MLPYLTKILVIVCCICFASCSASEQSNIQPIKVQLSKGLNASVRVGYDDEHGNFALKEDANLGRMFDGKADSYWISEPKGCEKVGILMTLEKPAYLRNVRITYHGKVLPSIGVVTIDQSTSEDSHAVWSRHKRLSFGINQELNISDEYYPSVLRGRVLGLGLEQCNEFGGKLEIAEIKFEFSDTPTMRPELTKKEIKTAIRSLIKPNSKSWNFADDDNEPNKEKYLSHLMYYGLLGDAEADELFMSYSPRGVDLSEDQSALESWYREDQAKKLKGSPISRSASSE
jgi:hypothetical protein